MAAKDPETRAHLDWLGMLQPVGLVVSPPALVKGQAVVPRNAVELQKRFMAALGEGEPPPAKTSKTARSGRERPPARLRDFPRFARAFLDWEGEDFVGGDGLPKSLEIALPEYQQVLAPTWAVPNPDEDGKWLMLIVEVGKGVDFDDAGPRDSRGWHASAQIRLERLLRDTKVEVGLLVSAETVRLVYAPAGESSGHLSFPVAAMGEVGGRPILAAFHMLLCAERLFTLPSDRRLPRLLVESRKYQNEVSTKLSEQVLRALGELLRGFVAADDAVKGALLGATSREDPQHIYGGLITTMMRLVFLLYAEERELMPTDAVYAQHYGVSGLFERLRADAGLYPDTMDQRYGAWARLLSLFRLVFEGGGHGEMQLPPRHGQLFNPDEYSFLEGRPYRMSLGMGERIEPPRVSDGVVYRVLEDLLILEGERLSYRSLDVEQIGSVYEAIMGFEVKRAFGASIGVRPQHVVVNLDELLAAKAGQRAKLLEKEAGCKLAKGSAKALKEAGSVEEVVAALGRKVSPQTPTPLAAGSLYLQPTEERRRSGSHYTPRALTEPIVRTTLRPVLEDLGERPRAGEILELKVCDPAMGSGAFLVEACRQLAGKVVEAWAAHGETPTDVPADETVELFARRKVAQRCLYGVDKNPFAVNLAKLSLWLVTLARDHAFTFIDHALKCGDSLVGLTRRQIEAFHWKEPEEVEEELPLFAWMNAQVGKASEARGDIFALEDEQEAEKRLRWRESEEAMAETRVIGDLLIAAFFADRKEKGREARRLELLEMVRSWRQTEDGWGGLRELAESFREGQGLMPFHWDTEFPEVFSGGASSGFSAVLGNPPFLGGTRIGGQLGLVYHDYLVLSYAPATGLADLIAFFLRKAYQIISDNGALGMIATNTVAQGDTRGASLAPIVESGGRIYNALRRRRWPGAAAVIVSAVHVAGSASTTKIVPELDGMKVPRISSFLLKGNVDSTPSILVDNKGCCYLGTKVWGSGFLFEEKPSKGSSSITVMNDIVSSDESCKEVISSYLGGKEFNLSPTQSPSRYVIDFGDRPKEEAQQWPALFAIVEERVKPVRAGNKQRNYRENWWLHANRVNDAAPFLRKHGRLLALASISSHLSIAYAYQGTVISNRMLVVLLHEIESFGVLQSRAHEIWARFTGSTLKDDLSYTTICFDTFPRPKPTAPHRLGEASSRYYQFRAELMVANNEGLTKTYNRFHYPTETSKDILKLRDLHDQMDRAVLDAYGWTDIKPTCEFLLDYEDDDENTSSKRKKPWRYRWPDEIQEEVLARLLDLNQKRAEEERLAGLTADKGKKKKKKPTKKKKPKRPRKKKTATKQEPLFDSES